jgi:hypothetical protein
MRFELVLHPPIEATGLTRQNTRVDRCEKGLATNISHDQGAVPEFLPADRSNVLSAIDRSGLNDAATYCLWDEAGCLVNIQLLYDPRAVRLARLYADTEHRCQVPR